MKTTNINTGSLLFMLFAIVLSTYSCIKDDNCGPKYGTYEFVLPFELSPAQSVFHIGDTITISSSIENPIYDRETKTKYQLDSFKFYLTTTIFDMDTNLIDFQYLDHFKLLIDSSYSYFVFNYNSGASDLNCQYNYKNNTYSIQYKLIPKKTGHFFFSQWSGINYFGGNQHFSGQCDKADIDAKIYMNGRNDNNFHLMNEAENYHYKTWNKHKEKYLDNGGYCFKVIE